MSWSYEASPLTSNLDAVRFLVGDTDSTDQQLQDEEINYLLTEGGVRIAAWKSAKAIAAKYARKIDRNVGDLRISFSQKYRQYLDLAEALRVDAASHVAPLVLALRSSAKDAAMQDSDMVVPFFNRLLEDQMGTGPSPQSGSPLVGP